MPRFLLSVLLLGVVLGVPAHAESDGDECVVSLVDLDKIERFQAGRDAEEILFDLEESKKMMRESTIELGRFRTTVGEEELTAHSYMIPDTDFFTHVAVFYTDEYLSTKSTDLTMQLGIETTTSQKPTGRIPRGSTTSMTLKDHDFAVSAAVAATVHSRRVRLFLDCCGSESNAALCEQPSPVTDEP